MYPHTVIYFVSCTLDLCSLRNDKQQLVPKNPKKSKICQNLPKKPNFGFFFSKFGFFLKILAFLANFGFFGQFWLFWQILDFM
jgi:hypothetical protein